MNANSILTSLAGWRGLALAFALGLAAGGFATSKVQGAFHATEIAEIEKTQSDEAAAQARLALAEIVRLTTIINGYDEDGYKELTRVQTENDKLRADIRAGAVRLSVRTTAPQCLPGDATARCLGDGAGRADIDPRDADPLVAITNRGDRSIVKMTFLQAYARACQSLHGSIVPPQ